jgi:acetyl-CoA carboxylase biotin carboxyl carrier protein
MDLQKIKALIELAAEARLSYLEYEEDGCMLRVGRGERGISGECEVPASSIAQVADTAVDATRPRADSPVESSARDEIIAAPMFGVFHLAAEPGGPPFVLEGDAVRKGQKLCLLEAMKSFHVVEAKRDGVVRAILAGNGQEVDAGQPLFRVE